MTVISQEVMKMTKQKAEKIVAELQGWDNIQIDETEDGYCFITAVDPKSHKRMVYNDGTGYFISDVS